ncbi:hypothetical protein TRIUR3_06041 [Triticum urartu]|uniref:Uncharacterized protein n=1 Tax=Triticum urartu TaxID=4572 RepID=M7ZTQ9_TRIUA|nr:hypothetical protein TRIUR3_06041 [Triticum urartu]
MAPPCCSLQRRLAPPLPLASSPCTYGSARRLCCSPVSRAPPLELARPQPPSSSTDVARCASSTSPFISSTGGSQSRVGLAVWICTKLRRPCDLFTRALIPVFPASSASPGYLCLHRAAAARRSTPWPPRPQAPAPPCLARPTPRHHLAPRSSSAKDAKTLLWMRQEPLPRLRNRQERILRLLVFSKTAKYRFVRRSNDYHTGTPSTWICRVPLRPCTTAHAKDHVYLYCYQVPRGSDKYPDDMSTTTPEDLGCTKFHYDMYHYRRPAKTLWTPSPVS